MIDIRRFTGIGDLEPKNIPPNEKGFVYIAIYAMASFLAAIALDANLIELVGLIILDIILIYGYSKYRGLNEKGPP